MIEAEEQAIVEKLVAHAPIETLTEAVLHRLSWRNEMPDDPVVLRPGEHGVRGELGPIVRDDHTGLAAPLETEIRIKVVSDGYDPTIGIMHEGNDGSSKFIFDLMEPERPKIDRAVLEFVKGHVFDPADFLIRS